MATKPNPFNSKAKEEQTVPAEEPATPHEAPPEGQQFTTSSTAVVTDKPGLVVHTFNREGDLIETVFPDKTFSDTEWSVNVQKLEEFRGKLVINPNAITAVEQR